jgi:hypothetical protein
LQTVSKTYFSVKNYLKIFSRKFGFFTWLYVVHQTIIKSNLEIFSYNQGSPSRWGVASLEKNLRPLDFLRNLRENLKGGTKGYFDLSREKP